MLLWKKDVDLEVIFYYNSCIHSRVRDNTSGIEWMLSKIYGSPEIERMSVFWDLLRSLGSSIDLPWLVYGDFNEILFQHEKRGGRL